MPGTALKIYYIAEPPMAPPAAAPTSGKKRGRKGARKRRHAIRVRRR